MRTQLRAAAALAVALATACGGGSTKSSPPLTVDAGKCCGDPNVCGSNICGPSLHCGNAQVPATVFVCCRNGSYCCTTDSDCQAYVKGAACDTNTSTCFQDCASNDDTRCAVGFHCEGSACTPNVADFGTGGCDEPSDCASGNCAADFDPGAATSVCAPSGKCAAGNRAVDVGYTLCTGSAFSRRCEAAGRWSARTDNPQPTGQTCDAGGGAASGFQPAATCRSGGAGEDPGFVTTCGSCAPYRATAAGCPAGCAGDDRRCWSGFHCAATANDTCVSNANGSACEKDAQCDSGRCDGTCMPKVAEGQGCDEDSDCASGSCVARTGICSPKKGVGVGCAADGECVSGHCANSLDPAATGGSCAPEKTCWFDGAPFPPGWVQCSAGKADSAYARRCSTTGLWEAPAANPYPTAQACDAGGGATSGFRQAASCTSGPAAQAPGFASTCVSCAPYLATATGCATSAGVGACCGDGNACREAACAPSLQCGAIQSPRPVYVCCPSGRVCCTSDADCAQDAPGGLCDLATSSCTTGSCDGDDARCAAGYHCAGSSCAPDLADGASGCTRSRDCASGHCSSAFDPSPATSICAPPGTCAAAAGASYPVGYALCAGAGTSARSRTCAAAGVWSPPATFTPAACTGTSGYQSIASCTSGSDPAVNGLKLSCIGCGRYLPNATFDGCRSSCAALLDCAPGSYCQGGACVASLVNGSPCVRADGVDIWEACQSKRCHGTCMEPLHVGEVCVDDGDCYAGVCDYASAGATERTCL